MDRPLRIGIAGVAHPNARAYALALGTIEGAELAAVWDRDPQAAAAFAAQTGTAVHAGAADLLGQLDALIVAMPPAEHLAIVALAAQAGLPVLCEPPLATSLAEAQALLDVCGEAGILLGAAFPLRYHYALEQLRAAIAGGALGELLFLRAVGTSARPAEWLSLAGGGAIINQAGQIADLLRWLSGRDFMKVYAETAMRYGDRSAEDAALLLIMLEGGVIASLDPSWSRPANDPRQRELTIEVTGTAGCANIDVFAQHAEIVQAGTAGASRRPWGDDLDALMLEDWLRSIRSGQAAPIPASAGMRALELTLAACRSAELGVPVAVGEE